MHNDNHFLIVTRPAEVGEALAEKIRSKLSDGAVLWLLSGGSAIEVAVTCMQALNDLDLSNLTVSLGDERYGPVGHPNSNWHQLEASGLKFKGANLLPFLNGVSLEETRAKLNNLFNRALNSKAYKIALLGMGADGHTAGILPGSPAVESSDLVASYKASDFQRLTLTFPALLKLDDAVLYATGDAKAEQLDKLAKENIEPARQPAQIIKRLPRWTVYNDRIGEEL